MLDAAQEGNYAYPAINCTSIITINAALKAFADSKSDGIIQFSTGAGQFASGLEENMKISKEYLALCAENDIVLEVEAGVVGGEEDGAAGSEDTPQEKLYTTPEDMVAVYEALHDTGSFTFAATFGNVHGHYKPGAVKLRPDILKQGQAAVVEKYGQEAAFDLVFHGGSGSELSQIRETLDYGVIKMNIDTDTQYAFTRTIADHMFKNYDGVLMVDQDVGNKKMYDPRGYLKKAEASMAERIVQGCDALLSSGKTLFGQA
jgi:fructose-bisphosphate aldolase class II